MMMHRLFLSLVLLCFSTQASACGFITSGDPKVGSTVSAPVTHVALTFTEKVFPASSTIAVLNANGQNMTTGKAYGDPANTNLVATHTEPLKPGMYKVSWHVLCACGSLMPGTYKFTVQ